MLDETEISVIAGRGGNGAVSFRREKYVPRGGPDGGDGGHGGDIVVRTDPREATLDSLANRKSVRAQDGTPGAGAKKHGRRGADHIINVPVGTAVFRDGQEIADLRAPEMSVVVARGGSGGKGNARFARPERQAPRIAERGLEGEKARVRLELRLLAEAGLVGLPNAGKSSLLAAISEARPKVGAYPFTTLEPYLGVVERGYDRIVVADIPGLIEGAHEGAGLGIRFLRHIERTLVLVHVVDASAPDPIADLQVVRDELQAYGRGLLEKTWLVALNKIDLPETAPAVENAARRLSKEGVKSFAISAAAGDGVLELVRGLFEVVESERASVRAKPLPVLRPQPETTVEVVRAKDGFEVHGDRATRATLQLGTDSEEARIALGRRLQRMGVHTQLRKLGAQPGDRVRIGEALLEWPL